MVGAHNHEEIGKTFDLVTIRVPPVSKLDDILIDTPFKANVKMTVGGETFLASARLPALSIVEV